jgi:hypothetical protein
MASPHRPARYVDGVAIKPSLALGGWVASKPAHGGAMAMDDAVKLVKASAPLSTKPPRQATELC